MTHRRHLLAAAAALAAPALLRAQHHGYHSGQFERLNQAGRIDLPAIHAQQAVTDSPAQRAPLPIPRTEMAWAVVYRNRVHLVGGYAEQRMDKPYHHAYDLAADRWEELPQMPRGANHVGVATLGDRLYAFGGFIEQNRTPHDEAFAFDEVVVRLRWPSNSWRRRTSVPASNRWVAKACRGECGVTGLSMPAARHAFW